MSWRLLLSDYPHAALKDELNVAVLAILEAGGFLTEKELAQNVKIEPAMLVKALLVLHGDRLVEYSRQRVRVSERGKALLDRLTVHLDILDSLVANFDLKPGVKERLKSEIAQYRARSFDQYLVSVATSRSWSDICRDSKVRTYLPRESEASGRLAIWLRDLSAWTRAEARAVDVIVEAKADLRAASHVESTARLALTWIEAMDTLDREPEFWAAVRPQSDVSTGLFCFHQQSRRRLDKTFFLDEWSTDGSWLHYLKSFNRPLDALQAAPAYASKHWVLLPVTPGRPGISNAGVESALRQQLSELLLKLMTAHSLSDLARTTTIDEASLKLLLEQVKDKCQTLLANSTSPREDIGETTREK